MNLWFTAETQRSPSLRRDKLNLKLNRIEGSVRLEEEQQRPSVNTRAPAYAFTSSGLKAVRVLLRSNHRVSFYPQRRALLAGALGRRSSVASYRRKLDRKSAAAFYPVDPGGVYPIPTNSSSGGPRLYDSRATRKSARRSCTRARRSCWNGNHGRSDPGRRKLVASFASAQKSSPIRRRPGSFWPGAQIECREKLRSGQ